jgi:hypothetical protein
MREDSRVKVASVSFGVEAEEVESDSESCVIRPMIVISSYGGCELRMGDEERGRTG